MTQRIDFKTASPGAFQAMLGMENHDRQCGLEHNLLELVKARVLQINGWNRLAIAFQADVES